MNQLNIALSTAERLIGLPYKWGGNDPMEGFDCSGLIVEILKSAGKFARNGDATAHQLSIIFKETDLLEPGTLVFWDWNNDGRMDHVEMIVSLTEEGELFTIGASGGDSSTQDEEDARNQDAYVKIRPLRDGYVKAVQPFTS